MPELPEVECVSSSLKKHIDGKEVSGLSIRQPHLYWTVNEEKLRNITGSTVCDVSRRGKYIIIRTGKGFLSIHLGMTGKILRKTTNYVPERHDHVIFFFSDFVIIYNDVRRFGYIEWIEDRDQLSARFARLGPEPCGSEFDFRYLSAAIKKRKKKIKEILMDSTIVVGIGNIYANEILFRARVSPLRLCTTLKRDELAAICRETKITLSEAIQSGGSSLRDYVDTDGKKGRFQEKHLVYSRARENCYVCDSRIIRVLQAGRATFICTTCQK